MCNRYTTKQIQFNTLSISDMRTLQAIDQLQASGVHNREE